jgi:hypothetical protein
VEPGFQPKLSIINTAVQQSKVQLTWEAPNPKRYEMITKKISPDKLEEMDLKDYLGSESEESNEEGEAREKEKDKYKRLLFEGKEGGEKGDDNLIISFKGGLEEEIEDTGKEEWNEEKHKEKQKRKEKKKHKMVEEEKQPDEALSLLIDKKNKGEEFKLNVRDPRFDSLYKDKRYLIDPSSKDFKKASKDVIREQIKRKKVDN